MEIRKHKIVGNIFVINDNIIHNWVLSINNLIANRDLKRVSQELFDIVGVSGREYIVDDQYKCINIKISSFFVRPPVLFVLNVTT